MEAALISRSEFSTPTELISLLDTSGRPDGAGEQERKRLKHGPQLECHAYKLDETAMWHKWVAACGVRVKGLRSLSQLVSLNAFFGFFSALSGQVGQIRIALRRDLSPASYGTCAVEEVPGSAPSGGDVLLLAKRFMADPEPYKVLVVMPAAHAANLQRSFAQPQGVSSCRPIGDNVRKNIKAKAPTLLKQGDLSLEAAAYLTSWSEGTLEKKPRPLSYKFLESHRLDRIAPGESHAWAPVRRERHVDLSPPGEASSALSDPEDGAEGEVMMAIDDA